MQGEALAVDRARSTRSACHRRQPHCLHARHQRRRRHRRAHARAPRYATAFSASLLPVRVHQPRRHAILHGDGEGSGGSGDRSFDLIVLDTPPTSDALDFWTRPNGDRGAGPSGHALVVDAFEPQASLVCARWRAASRWCSAVSVGQRARFSRAHGRVRHGAERPVRRVQGARARGLAGVPRRRLAYVLVSTPGRRARRGALFLERWRRRDSRGRAGAESRLPALERLRTRDAVAETAAASASTRAC